MELTPLPAAAACALPPKMKTKIKAASIAGDRLCLPLRHLARCLASNPIRFRTTISFGESIVPLLKALPLALASKVASLSSLFSLGYDVENRCPLRSKSSFLMNHQSFLDLNFTAMLISFEFVFHV